ncbi:MAG: hypothetical protein MI923_27470 [Phycisphaerales bacterium]|nr:hypothetical protein [Phycisphaerales bacterium]
MLRARLGNPVLCSILLGNCSPEDVLTASSNDCEALEAFYVAGVRAALEGRSEYAATCLKNALIKARWPNRKENPIVISLDAAPKNGNSSCAYWGELMRPNRGS